MFWVKELVFMATKLRKSHRDFPDQGKGLVLDQSWSLIIKKNNFLIPWVQILWISLRIRKRLLKPAGPEPQIGFPWHEQDQGEQDQGPPGIFRAGKCPVVMRM